MIQSVILGLAMAGLSSLQVAAPPAAPLTVWLRLDPLPGEMRLTPRESFAGVPPRFVLLSDGSVFVGGRRELLKGALSRGEMEILSRSLDTVLKSLKQTGPPATLSVGEGPPTYRFSALAGTPFQTELSGVFPEQETPPLLPLPDFIRFLANFRHPSLKPFDPPFYAMVVREQTLAGGCRTAQGLPSLTAALAGEVVVPDSVTRGFPTGAEMSQICEGGKRYTVVFRPLIPGER